VANYEICNAKHPKTDAVCTKNPEHVKSTDPLVQQHFAGAAGLKWPLLNEIDPGEGYNDYVTHRM